MKKKILLTLCASLLGLGLVSCGEENSSSSSSNAEPTSTGENAASEVIELLNKSNGLDASRIVSASLSVTGNEWHSVEVTDSTTSEKTSTHKITRYEGQTNNLTFYSDHKVKVETIDTMSNTDGTETVTKGQNIYGEAHDLLVNVASDYSDDAYKVNLSKSGSEKIVDSNPQDGELTREEANKVLNKGLIDEGTYGVTDYLLTKYFEGDKFFGATDAKDNAKLDVDGNKYTLTSTFGSKDDVENPLIEEYEFVFEFDNDGYLLAMDGSLATYAATMSSEQALDHTPTTEKGSKSYEWVIDFKQTLGTRTASGIDLEQYFFTSKNQISIKFYTSPFWAEEIDLTKEAVKNTEYVIRVNVIEGNGIPDIDKVHLYKVERNNKDASKDSYEIGKNDSNEETIKFKKGGEYTLHFKTALVEDITKEAAIIVVDLTSLAFKEREGVSSVYTKDNEYLPGSILAGETQFTLAAAPTNATDDVTVEILNNDIGATISKVDGSSFTYKLVTSNTGTITIKAVSASLGEEKAVTKEIKVYANTDEGITSFLSETTWIEAIPSTSGKFASLDFKATTSTTGTISYTTSSIVGGGFSASGTYSVTDGSIKLVTATRDPDNSTTQRYEIQSIETTPGRGDIVIQVKNAYPKTLMQN